MFNENESVVIDTIHAASSVDGAGDRCRGNDGVAAGGVGVAEAHHAADTGVVGAADINIVATIHGALVAAAIDSVDMTLQQDDVRQDVERTLVVSAKDGTHMVVGYRLAAVISFHIKEYCGGACYGDTVTATVDGVDMSTRVIRCINKAIDIDVDEGVGLYRLVVGVAVHTMFIVVVAVATAIDGVDLRPAREADIGPHIVQRGMTVGSNGVGWREATVGDLGHKADAVVAAIEGTLDGAALHADTIGAPDGGHVAATEDVAVDCATTHAHCSKTDECRSCGISSREKPQRCGFIDKAHTCQVAPSIDAAYDIAAANENVSFIVRGYWHTYIALLRIIKVGAFFVISSVITVIAAIAASKEVIIDITA